MIVHQIYAEIWNETVQNIMVCDNYEIANYLARCSYGEDAFAVDCLQYPCCIGDKYKNGVFLHVQENGSLAPIKYVLTQEQQVQKLENQLTAAQLALVEVYESVLNPL